VGLDTSLKHSLRISPNHSFLMLFFKLEKLSAYRSSLCLPPQPSKPFPQNEEYPTKYSLDRYFAQKRPYLPVAVLDRTIFNVVYLFGVNLPEPLGNRQN
jgi:hypothetical protein